MESDLALVQQVVTAILNLSVATIVGSGMATVWLRGKSSGWAADMLPRLRRAMLAGAVAATATHLAGLWLEAAAMAEVPLPEAFPAVQSVITATHYGMAWMLGAAALVVVAVVTVLRPGARASGATGVLRLAALALFLYSRSIVSHAGAAGDFTWAVAIDWLHLILISLWVGEVIVAGLVTLRHRVASEPASRADCARYVEALSTSATLALVGIFVTGVLSAWRGLGSLDNAFGNPYATILVVKVALVLCAAALGGLNRFIVMPSLLAGLRSKPAAGDDAAGKFARILHLEAVILVAVIVAAAFLSSTSPPMAS
jgi:putative copper resistance protein D